MFNEIMTKVNEIISLYRNIVIISDKIILDGENTPENIKAYKQARIDLVFRQMKRKDDG